jgi:hypothetical protein
LRQAIVGRSSFLRIVLVEVLGDDQSVSPLHAEMGHALTTEAGQLPLVDHYASPCSGWIRDLSPGNP